MQGKEKESAARIKKFMTMMDSMTNKELDSPDPKLWQQESRIMRIARGAGVHPNYVGELIGRPAPLMYATGFYLQSHALHCASSTFLGPIQLQGSCQHSICAAFATKPGRDAQVIRILKDV